MKLKRKHKTLLWIALGIGGGLLFCFGVYLNQTLPPDLPTDDFDRSSAMSTRDFQSWVCMMFGFFCVAVSVRAYFSLATKLRRP